MKRLEEDDEMMRHALSLGLSLMTLSACVSQSQWTPTVDTYGSSRAQYVTRDQQECRQLAMQTSGSSTGQAAQGAVVGGLLGAAGGAAPRGGVGPAGARRSARPPVGSAPARSGACSRTSNSSAYSTSACATAATTSCRDRVEEGGEMTMTYRVIVPLAALLGIAVAARAAEDKLTTSLRGGVEENGRASDAGE